MQQVKWFDRKFDFTQDQNIVPSIVERLKETPVRLEEKLRYISPDLLERRIENTWTIKENIGHLSDLEPLWQGRLEDILTGRELLRPTDLQNTRTSEANHDSVPIDELLSRFRKIRQATVLALEDLEEDQTIMAARHPRLRTQMGTMDLFLFVAEHDDHHLARISELEKLLRET